MPAVRQASRDRVRYVWRRRRSVRGSTVVTDALSESGPGDVVRRATAQNSPPFGELTVTVGSVLSIETLAAVPMLDDSVALSQSRSVVSVSVTRARAARWSC